MCALDSPPCEQAVTDRLCTSRDSPVLELAPICAWNEANIFGSDSPKALEKACAKTPLPTDRLGVNAKFPDAIEGFSVVVDEFTGAVDDATFGESVDEDIVDMLLFVGRTMTGQLSWILRNTQCYYTMTDVYYA